MSERPNLNARDSTGRSVSLLNDLETSSESTTDRPQFQLPNFSHEHPGMVRSHSNTSHPSSVTSPATPGLMRADSFDSANANGPRSPITPTYMGEYERRSSYTNTSNDKSPQYDTREKIASHEDYSSHGQYPTMARPSVAHSRTPSFPDPSMYEDESYGNEAVSEKGAKRYPCRYRESHGCNKSFTTSGHASRHSKIHTAEKAVHCVFQGCQKKFTRADNMKQHLETHYKERSRSTTAAKNAVSRLTSFSSIKKPASSPRQGRPSSRDGDNPELSPIDPGLYRAYPPATSSIAASPETPCSSSSNASSPLGDMSGIQHALSSQQPASTDYLDILATVAGSSRN